jgi:hypothetical protein
LGEKRIFNYGASSVTQGLNLKEAI